MDEEEIKLMYGHIKLPEFDESGFPEGSTFEYGEIKEYDNLGSQSQLITVAVPDIFMVGAEWDKLRRDWERIKKELK